MKDIFNLINHYGLRNPPNEIIFNNKKIPLINAIKAVFADQNIIPSELSIFDPFAGGGTFPLEISNLGIKTFSSDLNPVAVLIEKATCEYPQKLGKILIKELEIYFKKVQLILQKEMGQHYRNHVHPENHINFFICARQIKCPECGLWIPLIKNFYLSKKYQWAMIPKIPKKSEGDQVGFSIGWPNNSDGFYGRAKAICPRCVKTIPREDVMKSVADNEDHRILAIYEDFKREESNAQGSFRIPSFKEAQSLKINRKSILKEFFDKYPEIDIKFQKKIPFWMVQKYGITSVLKCFNSRQLLVMKTLLDAIIHLKPEIEKKYSNSELSKAIILYLTFGLIKIADYNSTLTELNNFANPLVRNTFKRAGLFMVGCYVETNPIKSNTTGGWLLYYNALKKVLNNLISKPKIKGTSILIKQMDAMDLDYEDESMDYCFTDPPYYNNIPYAASLDYFYDWKKAVLDSVFPELFLMSSTPKDTEIVQDSFRHGNSEQAKDFYEKGMAKAFSEIYRVLKKKGLSVIIFAHKDTNAWETLLQAVIDSKLVITNTWPLMMEVSSGIRGKNVITLDSVILLVCRKVSRDTKKYFDEDFRIELEKKIRVKLQHQWRLGFRGADFFLSALGPAIEEFSQFEAVLDVKTDKPIKLKKYLEFVDELIVKFSIGKALGKEETSTDAQTQLYLVWKASYKLASLPFDEVWKLTHALGLDDKKLEGKIIEKVRVKSKTVYQCLGALDKRDIFLKKKFTPSFLIEALQYSAFLWSENDPSLDELIGQYQIKYGDEFWHVSQALYNLIPDAPESKLFLGLMRKYGKYLKGNEKEKKKTIPKKIQQTFSVEGKNIILKKDDEK